MSEVNFVLPKTPRLSIYTSKNLRSYCILNLRFTTLKLILTLNQRLSVAINVDVRFKVLSIENYI